MQSGALLFYSQPIAIGTNGKLSWNRAARATYRSREIHEVMTMPRTVEEILRHADELAARFENYEPNDADELDSTAVKLLRDAIQDRSEAERHVIEAVRAARISGMSWSAIGTFVGTTGEAARQRYADLLA
jgi:hypothetical protein